MTATPAPGGGVGLGWSRASLVLLLVAALLLAPSLVVGTLMTHSSPSNLTWATQFSEQFRAGIPYPRWMPDSFDGLGGPAFYFYPPLPFWIDSLMSVATFNGLSVTYRMGATSLVLLWMSGLAMHLWLRRETASAQAALWGAIAYVVAPYHLLDHVMRGAFAEFTSYVFLPLVVLAIRLVADRHRGGPVLLAVSYAALVMSHLPTALLVSLTVMPSYVLFRAWQIGGRAERAQFLLRCVVGGAIGVGFSAIYLVPALMLLDWISIAQFWNPFYAVENWFVLAPGRWPEFYIMRVITCLVAATALLAAGLAVIAWRMPAGDPRRREVGFWTATSAMCLALIAGVAPWFWELPVVARVQFPWRLMVAVEFAAITALCLAPLRKPGRGVRYLFAAAIAALVSGVVLIARDTASRLEYAWEEAALRQHDVKEYQPRGYPQDPGLGYEDLALEPVANVPPVACSPTARICRTENERFGAMRMEIESDVPTTVVLRRFFFPAWRLEPVLPLQPTQEWRLVSFVTPPGRHTFRLQRVALPEEQWGWVLSGLSLALLLLWSVAEWRIRRP